MLAVVYRDPGNDIENSEWKSSDETVENGIIRIKHLLTKGNLMHVDEISVSLPSANPKWKHK